MKLLNCISIFIYEVKVLKQFMIFYSKCIIKNKFQPREKKIDDNTKITSLESKTVIRNF